MSWSKGSIHKTSLTANDESRIWTFVAHTRCQGGYQWRHLFDQFDASLPELSVKATATTNSVCSNCRADTYLHNFILLSPWWQSKGQKRTKKVVIAIKCLLYWIPQCFNHILNVPLSWNPICIHSFFILWNHWQLFFLSTHLQIIAQPLFFLFNLCLVKTALACDSCDRTLLQIENMFRRLASSRWSIFYFSRKSSVGFTIMGGHTSITWTHYNTQL